MALFDFMKICLFSEVRGVILDNGKPVVGAKVTRSAKYNQKAHIEETTTDESGKYYFEARYATSFDKILPVETVITQSITVGHQGKDFPIWKTVKRSPEEKDDLYGFLQNLTCDLSNEQSTTETEHNVIISVCSI